MSKAKQKLSAYLGKSNELLVKTSEELKEAGIENLNLKADRTLIAEAYNFLLDSVEDKLNTVMQGTSEGSLWLEGEGFKPISQASTDAELVDLLTEYVLDELE